jgi:rare lipoprotein A
VSSFIILTLAAPLAGCASQQRSWYGAPVATPYRQASGEGPRTSAWQPGGLPRGGGTYKVGDPYQIDGRWYVPREEPGYDRIGIASWYGPDFHGRKTANGEIYNMDALTAAHPTLPLPSYAYVTNLANGRTLLVRVNDRGPYANGRIVDLSRASGDVLGLRGAGLGEVRVRYAGPAPLDGDDRRERRFLAGQPWSRSGLSYASFQKPYAVGAAEPLTSPAAWSAEAYRSRAVTR